MKKPDSEPSDRIGRSKPAAGLYLVATPIGNLRDITLRALDILGAVDAVLCEDTRTTGRLLKAHGIDARLLAYHDHNAARVRPRILERLGRGERLALVSDAGTPLVSDPGYKLVRACAEAGIAVWPVPGASAALAALVASGLPSDRFFFAGFLPPKRAARRKALAGLAAVPGSLVIYEAPGRLAACLADMAAEFGPRPAAVARELTKLYEEIRRASLPELAEHYRAAGAPKGETVIVVAPPEGEGAAMDLAELDRQLEAALASMSVRDAAAAVAGASGLPRRQIYTRALELAGRGGRAP